MWMSFHVCGGEWTRRKDGGRALYFIGWSWALEGRKEAMRGRYVLESAYRSKSNC